MAILRALLILLCVASISSAAELTTFDGKKSTGEIVAINGAYLDFKAGANSEKHEITKLVAIEYNSKPKEANSKAIKVELIDGSVFRCDDFQIVGKNAVLSLTGTKQSVTVPANVILYMIRDISDPKLEQIFRNMLAKRGKRDVWIIAKGDMEKTLDAVPGTFGDGDAKGLVVQFEIASNNDKVSIQLSRVYGMILNQTSEIKVAQTICKVIDANNNTLYAKSLSVSNRTEMKDAKEVVVQSLTVVTDTGVRVDYPDISMVYKLDFSAGSMSYLSDLVPEKVELSSTEGVPEPYRRDMSLDKLFDKIPPLLKLDGKSYKKGLAIHSRTVLTYSLAGRYKLFEAIAGVDDCVEGDSSVKLTIEGDFKPIFSGVVKKGDEPKLLKYSVLNVKELRITVESEGVFDLGNQVDLVEAKVRK